MRCGPGRRPVRCVPCKDKAAKAGPRWEGDVALNLSTINNFGLIEIYETILRRGRSLSIDAGINYFDTASTYGNGESERNLGRALAGLKAKVIVGTKFRLAAAQISGRLISRGL